MNHPSQPPTATAAPPTRPPPPAATGAAALARAPLLALGVTLLVQMIASVGQTSPSVLAPVIARELGVGAQHVGWLVSLAYLSAMVSGLAGGPLAARIGSVRSSQLSLIASAAAMSLMAIGHPVPLLVGAVAMGVGYGLPNPVAADILTRHAPVDRRGLFFSIKQTGVPLGVALTGVMVPALLGLLSWRQTMLAVALLMGVLALLIGPSRHRLEPALPSRPAAPGGPRPGGGFAALVRERVWRPLVAVMRFAPTRRLGITSLIYAFTQVSFLTFLVSLLTVEYRLSLTLAASLLAASQAASVVARVGWGHVADRWVDPAVLLGALGLMMGVCVAALGLSGPGAPVPWLLLVSLCCAATAVSWNGVYYADLVRHVPPEQVAQTTGATQFLTFMGGMGGAAAFAGLVSLVGRYSWVYLAVSLLPMIAGVFLWRGARRVSPGTPPAPR